MFCLCPFIYLFIYFTLTLSPLRPSRSVRQNYTYAELLRSTLSYILEGSDSCSRRLNFRHLASSCFKSEELVGNLILPLSATMIELCFDSDTSPTSTLFQFLHGVKYVENWPNFGPWGTSVPKWSDAPAWHLTQIRKESSIDEGCMSCQNFI